MKEGLDIWRQKLDYLQKEEAIEADAVAKFALAKRIEEAKSKIAELEAATRKASLVEGQIAASKDQGQISERCEVDRNGASWHPVRLAWDQLVGFMQAETASASTWKVAIAAFSLSVALVVFFSEECLERSLEAGS